MITQQTALGKVADLFRTRMVRVWWVWRPFRALLALPYSNPGLAPWAFVYCPFRAQVGGLGGGMVSRGDMMAQDTWQFPERPRRQGGGSTEAWKASIWQPRA